MTVLLSSSTRNLKVGRLSGGAVLTSSSARSKPCCISWPVAAKWPVKGKTIPMESSPLLSGTGSTMEDVRSINFVLYRGASTDKFCPLVS